MKISDMQEVYGFEMIKSSSIVPVDALEFVDNVRDIANAAALDPLMQSKGRRPWTHIKFRNQV